MKSKIVFIGCILLGGCVATNPVVTDGRIDAAEFKVGFVIPDQNEASMQYQEKRSSRGDWLQTLTWNGGGRVKRFVMEVVDMNGLSYFADRRAFSESVPKLDPSLKSTSIKFGVKHSIMGKTGVVTGQRFDVESMECVAFHAALRLHPETGYRGLGDGGIGGYYCAPSGVSLGGRTVLKFLSSIYYKGKTL